MDSSPQGLPVAHLPEPSPSGEATSGGWLITTGTASEHDSPHFDEVLDEHNTSADVYADRGYPSAQRSEMLKALGYREHIQRKAKAGQPLSECQKGRNKRIAKTRARVEHPFAQMRHMGGKFIRTMARRAPRWQ